MKLKDILVKFKKTTHPTKYSSVSDFFLKSSDDEKKKVFTEVAKKANKDQRKLFRQANL
jgi:hypothetical protein